MPHVASGAGMPQLAAETAAIGPADKLVAADIMFAAVGGGVWAIASLKMAPSLNMANNAQAALGLAASECPTDL